MRYKRLLACCVLLATPAAVSIAAQPAQPVAIKRFAGGYTSVFRQLGGSAVCTCGSNVFLAADDPRRWAAVPVQTNRLPEYPVLHPVGGNRNHLFFVNRGNAGFSLLAVRVGGDTTVLRSVSGFLAAFATGDAGVIANGSDLFITSDAGGTWNQAASLERREEVSALAWASDSRSARRRRVRLRRTHGTAGGRQAAPSLGRRACS